MLFNNLIHVKCNCRKLGNLRINDFIDYYINHEKKEINDYLCCKEHKTQKYISYCLDCKLNLCEKCLTNSKYHENHSLENILNVESHLNEIKGLIKKKRKKLSKGDIENRKILNIFENMVKLYNDFTRLGSSSVPLRERGVPSKDKQSSLRRPRVSVDEILVNGFNDFLMGDIENFITYIYGLKRDGSFVKPNVEWGCEKLFENFRFESKLSTFMYDVCYNYYMGLIKIEFPSQSKNSRKDAIMNILAAVFEKNPLKELIRKKNKERIFRFK